MKKSLFILTLLSNFAVAQVNQQYNYEAAFTEIDIFWKTNFAYSGNNFRSVKVNFFNRNYPVRTACGSFNDLNCFYCGSDNSVSMSIDLMNYLKSKGYSNSILYFIVAHEYGHAVAYQLNKFDGLSVDKELQADCLSGVFFNKVASQNRLDRYDIPHIVHWIDSYQENGRLLKTLFDPQSHGNAKMRKDAFGYGLQIGNVSACFEKHNIKGSIDEIINGLSQLGKKN